MSIFDRVITSPDQQTVSHQSPAHHKTCTHAIDMGHIKYGDDVCNVQKCNMHSCYGRRCALLLC